MYVMHVIIYLYDEISYFEYIKPTIGIKARFFHNLVCSHKF